MRLRKRAHSARKRASQRRVSVVRVPRQGAHCQAIYDARAYDKSTKPSLSDICELESYVRAHRES